MKIDKRLQDYLRTWKAESVENDGGAIVPLCFSRLLIAISLGIENPPYILGGFYDDSEVIFRSISCNVR